MIQGLNICCVLSRIGCKMYRERNETAFSRVFFHSSRSGYGPGGLLGGNTVGFCVFMCILAQNPAQSHSQIGLEVWQ